jgi:hypothetical protein
MTYASLFLALVACLTLVVVGGVQLFQRGSALRALLKRPSAPDRSVLVTLPTTAVETDDNHPAEH